MELRSLVQKFARLEDENGALDPMPWFDDPGLYYGKGYEVLSQGDIILTPLAILVPDAGGVAARAPDRFGEERLISLWTAVDRALPEAPSTSARVSWGAGMVLPHGCALEKEFNERIDDLIDEGMSEVEAEELANADPTLDRSVVLAPLRLYETLPENRRAGARQGTRLGSFPIVADPVNGIPESYVDFTRACTVDIGLLPISARIASLSTLAIAHLQVGLAKFWAYRAESRLEDLERAVGQRIVEVHPISGAKKLSVNLVLEDGSKLTLQAATGSEPAGRVPERRPRLA